MFVARKVDADATGVLNTERRMKGKQILVREFLEENHDERWFKHVAPSLASKSIQDATNSLVNTEDFASSMFKLRLASRPGNGRAGRGSRACLDEPADIWRADPKHKQPAIQLLKETARGTETIKRRARSRSELLAMRKADSIKGGSAFLVPEDVKDFKRVDLITISKAWDRCNSTSKSLLNKLYAHQQ